MDEVTKCARKVLFNQVFLLLPITIALPSLYLSTGVRISSPLPSVATMLFEIVCMLVWQEIAFYYSHLLLHTRYFYGKVHKVHHEFKAPIGMAAIYAEPFEFIVSNIAPLFFAPVLCRTHILSAWVWFIIATAGTINHHSGYAFPWLVGHLSPRFHDYHHSKFDANFGLLGWLDRLHGTDTGFHAHVAACEKASLEGMNKKE
jgi:methylsterol monooxygenase